MSAQSTPPRGGAREAWDAPSPALPEEDDAAAPAFAASPSARDGGGGGSLLSASARAPGALACCAPASVVSQQRWARCATFTLGASYALVLATAALSLYALVTRKEGLQTWAYAIGLISLFLALPISLYDIHQHISHMVSPLQIRYVRILAMVPLYSIESWLALFFRQQRVGLELARELYEAFVIYNTFALLVDFLGGAAVAQALLRSHGVRGKHIFCLARLGLRGWHTDNGEFYRRCSLCVLQYVVVRVALALLTAALSTQGLYCEGEWRWGACAYPYFTVALSLSQFAAIYGLFLFRHELSAELEPIRPWPKLVCVKVIVFATFWLGAALHGAQLAGLIEPSGGYSSEDVTAGVANLSVCVMCAAVALGHHYSFGLAEFKNLAALVPQNAPSLTLGEVVVAVLPRPKDLVEVPLQVVQEGLRVMVGVGSGSGAGAGKGGGGAAGASEGSGDGGGVGQRLQVEEEEDEEDEDGVGGESLRGEEEEDEDEGGSGRGRGALAERAERGRSV